jgi:hypothetical protein
MKHIVAACSVSRLPQALPVFIPRLLLRVKHGKMMANKSNKTLHRYARLQPEVFQDIQEGDSSACF